MAQAVAPSVDQLEKRIELLEQTIRVMRAQGEYGLCRVRQIVKLARDALQAPASPRIDDYSKALDDVSETVDLTQHEPDERAEEAGIL